jgi:hypothetical protein
MFAAMAKIKRGFFRADGFRLYGESRTAKKLKIAEAITRRRNRYPVRHEKQRRQKQKYVRDQTGGRYFAIRKYPAATRGKKIKIK